jgi:hypothetical protein
VCINLLVLIERERESVCINLLVLIERERGRVCVYQPAGSH